MSVRGKAVTIFDSNPYQVMDDSGKARPTTRLLVSDLPLEFPTAELENALTKLGCELASKTLFELERDQFNWLTCFKNGRRFVYILVPGKPLPRTVTIHGYSVKLYHREQPKNTSSLKCFNCGEIGHVVKQCPSPLRCRLPDTGDQPPQPAHFPPLEGSQVAAEQEDASPTKVPDDAAPVVEPLPDHSAAGNGAPSE